MRILVTTAIVVICAAFIVAMTEIILILDTVVPANLVAIVSDSENAVQWKTVQWKTVQMRVTAYCPCSKCCGSYSDGITASGHKISQGDRFVAADKTYPFGTEMLIPGYKNSKNKNSDAVDAVEVLDRGGAIRGKRLDVFFNTHQEALEWGVRHLDVKIREQ
jgi:3D (Asp-Asp-Asp) domain-containing protein